ncbi:MAG TPA: UDP-N-acetylmuramoyl-L-alanyl-D-glutamate--2,6-diaminopimelate ligase [Spirochaetia bacterium]|nr:UDP-N-acetylmuramoyl-L-alanyl-D-glutamate--2,6-diaminopimelate ligase [Spirochaetales bacterium]HPD80151.1 UDP-N-acetylmuramoyl-L-alanyl-D-glutamate--2,6-diaminopimelate ligase [Spirochaetales bacterium]HQK34967.1 UDP-N-acetylmuramoyl-L-alanyl-D-glutamate--2,6-diaminopimelate ligase [Spirochaetales bacterium]HRS65759.1 UDP-N-acetylmuramoyl-L-alanyl-D-glutamate--2,6-diaminopimelate ligase [Spirochaetia bacterium]
MEQHITRILDALPEKVIRNYRDCTITGLSYDSRHISTGYAYFALPGLHTDGHAFIDDAIQRGAACIIHEHELLQYHEQVMYVQVPNSRTAMSPAAAAFWGHPSRTLITIGVTGTEGKSTVTALIAELLNLAGYKAGFISTVAYKIGTETLPNPEHQTTPEATTIHEKLHAMLENNMEYAVLESSSHGLSKIMNRLGDVDFDAGLLTNIRHEHLEFHKTWENYRNDKANLFRALTASAKSKGTGNKTRTITPFGVVCKDDPSSTYVAQCTSSPVYTYSVKTTADCYATNCKTDSAGSTFVITLDGTSYPARIHLPGAFNIENALGALLLVQRLTGDDPERLISLLPQLTPITGRMTRIDMGQPFEVIVDYAHTPSSFEAIFPSLREQTKTRLICVFGSGGERDTLKRPEQGAIAAKYCDYVILSDEDPRGEDPMTLLMDIAKGCTGKTKDKDLFLIPDRAQGIRKALELAVPGSTVALLGKGHENTIIYNDRVIPWNEIEEAKQALIELGYTKGRT